VLDLFGGRVLRIARGSLELVFSPSAQPPGPAGRNGLAGPRDKRVGLVHAVTNGLAIGMYAASWVARRRGRHGSGARFALAGAAVSGVGGYLGAHLASARKLGSRHPAYGEASVEV